MPVDSDHPARPLAVPQPSRPRGSPLADPAGIPLAGAAPRGDRAVAGLPRRGRGAGAERPARTRPPGRRAAAAPAAEPGGGRPPGPGRYRGSPGPAGRWSLRPLRALRRADPTRRAGDGPLRRGTARAAPRRAEWRVPAGVGGARQPRGAVHQPRGAAFQPPGTHQPPPRPDADRAPRRRGHRLAIPRTTALPPQLPLQHMSAMCSPRAEDVCGMWRQVTAFFICPPHQLHGRCTGSGLPDPCRPGPRPR